MMKTMAGGLVVVLSMTGCAAMRNREWGSCTVAGALVGGAIGGVTGGAAMNNSDREADDEDRGAAIGGGVVGGAVLGALLGHLLCDPLPAAPAPPPPAAPRAEVFRLDADALFDTAKWVIKPAGKSKIDEVVKAMKSKPDTKATIEGHTDARGSDAYNQRLSERRAGAVAAHMESGGIAKSRLTTRGYGESKPVGDNKTAAGMQSNRRVEITVR